LSITATNAMAADLRIAMRDEPDVLDPAGSDAGRWLGSGLGSPRI
jgi:hypothetical protein